MIIGSLDHDPHDPILVDAQGLGNESIHKNPCFVCHPGCM